MSSTHPHSQVQSSAPPTSRLANALVLVAACLLAVALPAGYFGIGFSALGSSLQTKSDVAANVIHQMIGAAPNQWRAEESRLLSLLSRVQTNNREERASVFDAQGALIVSSAPLSGGLSYGRRAPLYSGNEQLVGHVEVRGSLAPLLQGTALAAVLGLGLAGLLFGLLNRLQAREKSVADAAFDKQERARVTLESIGDGVITINAQGKVDYLNPVAEQLTHWTLENACGKDVADICRLVDDQTQETVAPPVIQALRDNQPSAFSGRALNLQRPDGSTVAVEDSASPIHGRRGEVIGAALVLRDVSATRGLAQRINWDASHDALTGLINRHEFEMRIETALESASASGRHHVMCYLDLDQFKIVNDTCGHAAGDALLKQLADLLLLKLRESDTLARLGGDEFGVLLEGCPLEKAQIIAADLLAAIHDHRFAWEDKSFAVGVSIGLVAIDSNTASGAEVFSAADTACYSAKEQGRNRVCVFHTNNADMAQRRHDMGWASRLTSALEQDRFTLYYQTYLALGADPPPGKHIEILIRLIDEDGKLVPPGSFLPAAERYNIIPQIDRWVIRTVFSRYRELATLLGAPLTCAINLSGATLNTEGMLEYLQEQVELHNLPPNVVCFEITETAAINNLRNATQFMRSAKTLGFRFALDDFGIGSSSLAYLRSLPVDYLKIDGSFVRNIVDDPVDLAMADTINRVGHIMGLKTVGEFAENDDVINELRKLGVDFAQGYGVQRPLPLPTFASVAEAAAATAVARVKAEVDQKQKALTQSV